MAFEIKTLPELVRISENALSMQFLGRAGALRKSVLKVIATAIGGLQFLMSLLAKKIWKNAFITTCDVEALDGFGADMGMPHKAPSAAVGSVIVSFVDGNSTTEVSIPRGTAFVDGKTRKEYEAAVDTVVSASGNRSIPIVAVDYGSVDSHSDTLGWQDAEPEDLKDSVIVEDIHGGISVDVIIDGEVQQWGETAEQYRQRLLRRRQHPSISGSEADYESVATCFQGVTDAYILSGSPRANVVNVAVANMDNGPEVSGETLNQVRDYMTSDAHRDVTADVRVFSVAGVKIGLDLYIAPFNDATKQSVKAAIKSHFAAQRPGSVVNADDFEVYIRSNANVEELRLNAFIREGYANDGFSLQFDPDEGVAEIAVLDETNLIFRRG